MRIGSKRRLAVALLVLCTAQLLVSSTVEAHRNIAGPNVIRVFLDQEPGAEVPNHLENLDASADRLGWKNERGLLRVVQDDVVIRDLKRAEEEPRPEPEPEEEPIWSKAWSFVSRLASPVGNVFDPLSSWGRKLVLNADEAQKPEHEHELEHPRHHDHVLRDFLRAPGRDGPFHYRPSGEHRGPFYRFHEEHRGPYHRFGDDFHRGPHREHSPHDRFHSVFERIGGVSSKRPDWVHPVMDEVSVEEMDTKVMKVVLDAVDEFSQTKIAPPQEGTACLEIFEEQLKTLIRSVKSALREQVCTDDAASGYNICKLSHSSPRTAALMAFAKASVNPIAIAQTQVQQVCASPDALDSLQQVEVLASHIQLDDLERHLANPGAPWKHFDREHGYGKSRFGGIFRRDEHGPKRLRPMKNSVTESLHDMHKHEHEHEHEHEGHEHQKREHQEHQHNEHGDYWRTVKDKLMERMHKENEHEEHDHKEHDHKEHDHKEHDHKEHDHKEHDHKEYGLKKHEHEDEHHGHEEHQHEHHGSRFFGLVHRLKHAFRHDMHHHKGLGADEHDCFVRGIHRLKRGLKEEAMMACSSASSPELTAACEFAKEHKFLAKTYIALRVDLESTVATHCAAKQLPPHESVDEDDQVDRVMEFPRYRQFKVGEPLSFDRDMPHLKRMSGCARHRAHQAFRRALQLRGHLLNVARAAHAGDVSDEVVNLDEIHEHEAALVDLLHGAFPELKDTVRTVRTFLEDSEKTFVEQEKPLRFLDPSDPSKGFAELRIHSVNLPASSRKVLLGPAMRHRTVDFPTTFMNGHPHFRISARPKTIPDVNEKVDVEDMKSSKIVLTEEGH